MATARARARLRVTSMLVALAVGSGVVLMSVAAAPAGAKSCSPDGGKHVATARIHTTRTSIYGYSIRYTRRSGFRLGDTNNERSFYRVKGDPGDIRRPWWGTPDSGRAGSWTRRDRMPDLDHARRFYVEAEFDKRGDDDPTCTIEWKKGLP